MTAILLKVIIYAAIAGFIYFGIRRIWRDWTKQFRSDDQAKRTRDLNERARPDVIDLQRGPDGIYRPPGERDKR